jgi:hypothetical protein
MFFLRLDFFSRAKPRFFSIDLIILHSILYSKLILIMLGFLPFDLYLKGQKLLF